MRNESKGVLVGAEVGTGGWNGLGAPSTDRLLARDLSLSILVGTRKMVNYA